MVSSTVLRWHHISLAFALVLATIAGSLAGYPQQLVLSNPYPVETASYRAANPYSTPYMTTGYSPLGTTGYAPSYGWTSAYVSTSYRPFPLDHFGPRVVSPYDSSTVYGYKTQDPVYVGAYNAYGGYYFNQFSHTLQAPVFQGDSRLAPPAQYYPAPLVVQSEWR